MCPWVGQGCPACRIYFFSPPFVVTNHVKVYDCLARFDRLFWDRDKMETMPCQMMGCVEKAVYESGSAQFYFFACVEWWRLCTRVGHVKRDTVAHGLVGTVPSYVLLIFSRVAEIFAHCLMVGAIHAEAINNMISHQHVFMLKKNRLHESSRKQVVASYMANDSRKVICSCLFCAF